MLNYEEEDVDEILKEFNLSEDNSSNVSSYNNSEKMEDQQEKNFAKFRALRNKEKYGESFLDFYREKGNKRFQNSIQERDFSPGNKTKHVHFNISEKINKEKPQTTTKFQNSQTISSPTTVKNETNITYRKVTMQDLQTIAQSGQSNDEEVFTTTTSNKAKKVIAKKNK